MVDISDEENKAIHSQLIMNKFNLNQDVVNYICSFIFYDKNEYNKIKLQKIYKKALIDRLNMDIVKFGQQLEYEWHWHIAFNCRINTNEKKDVSINIQAINCCVCGRYTMFGNMNLHMFQPNSIKYIVCDNVNHSYIYGMDYDKNDKYNMYNEYKKRLYHLYGNYNVQNQYNSSCKMTYV